MASEHVRTVMIYIRNDMLLLRRIAAIEENSSEKEGRR